MSACDSRDAARAKSEEFFKEQRQKHRAESTSLSERVRGGAFAGIAVVWVFTDVGPPVPKPPAALIGALLLFGVTIALDLLQYLVATILWFGRYKWLEKEFGHDVEQAPRKNPGWIPTLVWVVFWAKVVALVLGYGVLLRYLWAVWGLSGSSPPESN